MLRWPHLLGAALGVVAGTVFLAVLENHTHRLQASGPIISECDGRLRELVVHYDPGASNMVAPVYRDFLHALDRNVTVHVVCPAQDAFTDFTNAIGPVGCSLSPIIVNHPITTWSRDRWVAFLPAKLGGPVTIWSPRGETGDEVWPARAGDERVGKDIADALSPTAMARRSALYFDGGDFLADNDNVFVVPRVLKRNLQNTVHDRDEFLKILSLQFKRRVVLLDEAPDHHAGMFMASIGNHVMLVGDPSLGRKFFSSAPSFPCLPGGPDFSAHTQHLFDAVAAQCAALGYKIVRIPVVPACDGRSYLTYVNVLLDQQGARRIVYLPYYRGADALNAGARQIWRDQGYEIHPVDCTTTYTHFGCLHCLVNILRRS